MRQKWSRLRRRLVMVSIVRSSSEMRGVLKDGAELAYKMEDIPKPDLVDLMSLFISRGFSIQKKKWLDRMGYR